MSVALNVKPSQSYRVSCVILWGHTVLPTTWHCVQSHIHVVTTW